MIELNYKELSVLHFALRNEMKESHYYFLNSDENYYYKERFNIAYGLFKKLIIDGIEDEQIQIMYRDVNL